jgi:hypothetical protein
MPRYKYTCKDCGNVFEMIIGYPVYTECSRCHGTEFKIGSHDIKKNLNTPQPNPKSTNLPCSWSRVIEVYKNNYGLRYGSTKKVSQAVIKMMEDRDQFGFEKYGMHITPFNGRNSLVDLIQEKLDSLVYAQNCIDEGLDMDNRIKLQMNTTLFDLEELYEILVERYPEKALV